MFDEPDARIWPVTLTQIETAVSAYLGPGRESGNRQDECFSLQISMYLAKLKCSETPRAVRHTIRHCSRRETRHAGRR
jgi:hypothetical protein